MKKLFTLVMALVALTICAKAQTVFSDDFESYAAFTVNPAGSWTYLDIDGASTYGLNGATWTNQYYVGSGIVMDPAQVTPSQATSWAPHSGNQFFAIWDAVPSEIVSGTTTNDWIITPELTLTGPAILSFYAREVVDTYGPEVVNVMYSTTTNAMSAFTTLQTLNISEVAWTEHTFNIPANTKYVAINVVSDDVFGFFLDDFTIFYQPTTPTIQVAASMDFGTIMAGTTTSRPTNVTTFNLTSAVTATTAAPFAVSADGTTWNTTATIPQAGGNLYVQYAPTAAGTDNGTVTLTSGSANATITLTGNAFDCGIASIPYFTDFTSTLNDCWTIIDANADENTFTFNTANAYAGYMYSSTDDANDWLISPTFTMTGSEVASFDYSVSPTYPETFQVFALGDDTIALTSVITTAGPATQNIDLTSLSGDYQIGIHCTSPADEYYFRISNFTVESVAEGSLTVVGDTLDFRVVPNGSTSNPLAFIINTSNFTEATTITAVAPFEVSLDGTTFAATVALPAPTTMFTTDTIYARFAPTTPGTYNDVITIASTSTNNTVVVLGESVDCSEGISTFPFVYDFSTGTYPPTCWTVNNEENFDVVEFNDEHAQALIVLDIDRLVTPEIHSNNPLMLSFEHMSYAAATGETPSASTFRVGYSSTNTDAASFTWLANANVSLNGIETYTTPIPAGTKYISIDLVSLGSYLFYGFFEVPDYVIYDNFTLTELTEPTMLVNDQTMDFGSVIYGNTVVKSTVITAALLTSPISVSAPANFEVSADGNAYAATATIPAEGGNLYVKYNPTAVGTHSGNITVTSGSLTTNIAVSGNAVDCSTPAELPFTEDFESELSGCWMNLDNDGDGFSWYTTLGSTLTAHSGNGTYASASYDNPTNAALTPNNWLITPQIVIPANGATLKWWVAAQDPDYPADHYEVMVSTTGTDAANFTSIFDETLTTDTWKERVQSLANYAGQTVRIAFVHDNCTDAFIMKIDDISVSAGVGVEEYNNNVTVFPNPANNVLNVNANSNITLVEVYNLMGQKIAAFDVNSNSTQINTAALTSGVYMLKINTENGVVNQKVTIAR